MRNFIFRINEIQNFNFMILNKILLNHLPTSLPLLFSNLPNHTDFFELFNNNVVQIFAPLFHIMFKVFCSEKLSLNTFSYFVADHFDLLTFDAYIVLSDKGFAQG